MFVRNFLATPATSLSSRELVYPREAASFRKNPLSGVFHGSFMARVPFRPLIIFPNSERNAPRVGIVPYPPRSRSCKKFVTRARKEARRCDPYVTPGRKCSQRAVTLAQTPALSCVPPPLVSHSATADSCGGGPPGSPISHSTLSLNHPRRGTNEPRGT